MQLSPRAGELAEQPSDGTVVGVSDGTAIGVPVRKVGPAPQRSTRYSTASSGVSILAPPSAAERIRKSSAPVVRTVRSTG